MNKKEEKNWKILGVLLSVIILLIGFCIILIWDIRNIEKYSNLQYTSIGGVDILRLYDTNKFYDKSPKEYVCSDNVLVEIIEPYSGNSDGSSYFSTWHKDERGTRGNELGMCFIKW